MDELTKLARSARAGDRDALDSFVRAGYQEVWRLCAALVDRDAADDLAQETFLRATGALRRFRGDSSARTWLLSIAKRVCFDELRSRHRRRRGEERLTHDAVAEARHAPDVLQEVTVRDALLRLDPDRRAAWALTQMLRMSYEDAAIVCDCPSGTIRSRVSRARDELIQAMRGAQESTAKASPTER